MDPTEGKSFHDLARLLSPEDATPDKLKERASMAESIAAKLQLAADAGPVFSQLGQAAATNLQAADWLHSTVFFGKHFSIHMSGQQDITRHSAP